MNNGLLNEVIMKRKKRKTSMYDEDVDEQEECATPGIDSEDLDEVDSVVLGDGVKKETISKSHSQMGSTDELSPSRQEMRAKGIDGGEEDNEDKDKKIFDPQTFDSVKNRKPKGLYERMMKGLGDKLNK